MLPSVSIFAQQYKIGEKYINLPSPNNFADISSTHPKYYADIIAMTVPASNEAVGLFLTNNDIAALNAGQSAKMDRYLMVQSNKAIKDANITKETFAKVVNASKNQTKKMKEELDRKITQQQNKTTQIAKEKFGVDLDFSQTDVKQLGAFNDSPEIFSTAAIRKITDNINGQKDTYFILSTTNLINVKNKLIYAYAYSVKDLNDDIDAELEWLRNTSTQWSKAIIAAN